MYYIHNLELATQRSLPLLERIVRRSGVLELSSIAVEGTLLTYPLKPRLAERWEGFEVYPDEHGIGISVLNPDTGVSFQLVDGVWIPADDPVFHTAEQVRDGLINWQGPIQFRLKLSRIGRRSPRLFGVRVGCHIPRDLLSDVLNLALPETLRVPVELSRFFHLPAGETVLPALKGINLARVVNHRLMLVPQQRRATVTKQGDKLLLDQPLATASGAHLIFDYVPLVAPVEFDDSFQVSEVPVVVLRLLSMENPLEVHGQEWARTPGNTLLMLHTSKSSNALIELTVVAQTDAEARAIAMRLQGQLYSKGFLTIPQFGIVLPVLMQRGGIQPGPGQFVGEMAKGGLEAATFRFLVGNLPEGQWTKASPLILSADVPQIYFLEDESLRE